MRFNILVKPFFQNSRFSAIRNLDFTCSHTLAVQKWTCVILIERFGPNPFSHFLLAEKQIEHFGEMFHPFPFTRHKWTLLGSAAKQNLIEYSSPPETRI